MSKKELCPECGNPMVNVSHRIYSKQVKDIKRSKIDSILNLCLRCQTGKIIDARISAKSDIQERLQRVEKNTEVVSIKKHSDGTIICSVKIIKPKFQSL